MKVGRNIGAKQTKTQRTNKGKKMKWTKNKKLTRENQGRKRRIPDQRSKGSKKWKRNNSQSMEERERKIFRPDKFSAG